MGRLLDLVLPPRCAACGAPTDTGLCPACLAAAAALTLPTAGWERLADGVAAVGLFAYDGVVRDAVHGLKVAGRFGAAGALGALLRERLPLPPGWPLTWVPAPARRRRERGFDVPRLLAGDDAVALLRRTAARPDQTSLTAAARRCSPAGTFAARRDVPPAVVLVDDVRTTGATALAAADALRRAGACRVLVATLAVGGAAARAEAHAGLSPRRPAGA